MSQTSYTQYTHSTSPIDAQGVVRCPKHSHLPAALRTAKTDAHRDKQFYCCPLDMNDPQKCKFFKWANDPMFAHLPRPDGGNARAPGSTSSQSQPPSQASQSNSLKRLHSPPPVQSGSQSIIQPGPSSQAASADGKAARLQAIEAALAEKVPSTVQFPMPGGLSQESDTTLHEASSSQRLVDSPSVKRQRFDSGSTNTDTFVSLASSPVQSISDLESLPATKDTELFSSQEASTVTAHTSAGTSELNSNDIITQVEALSAHIPAHIRKLEKKIKSLEQSNQAKAKRIENLEKDILSLASRNRSLEDQIRLLT